MRLFALLLAIALCVAAVAGCKPDVAQQPAAERVSPFASASSSKPKVGSSESKVEARPDQAAGCSHFVDVAEALHILHTYDNGARGMNLMVEATGGGCGWIDFDGDGFADLYLNQGGNPVAENSDSLPTDQLFWSLDGKQFRNVTDAARIRELHYGQGLAVGDYDGDGWDDIYVTNVGRNTLYHNLGDGTFVDVTESTGVGDQRWSTCAAWADLDGDGWLDLYVANYCDYDPHHPIICQRENEPRICHPKDVPPATDELFRNRADGTFTAEAEQRGLVGPLDRGLGVIVADFDRDGDLDVYVANDTTANFFFENDGHGMFTEVGSVRGCAVDRNGSPQASMGLACGDYDGDGWLDIYSTHFYRESNTLYRNLGPTGFEDVTGVVGLHEPTLAFLGWGSVMADYNQDGRQELFVANGHIDPTKSMDGLEYEMEAQHFEYDGPRWHECSAQAGDYFKLKRLGRGVAACDFDHDGDVDLCVVNQNAQTALLENRSPRGHWLQVQLIGESRNRHAVGATVIVTAGEKTYLQQQCGGTSYAAAHDPVLTYGLGAWDSACTVEIRWPNGGLQQLPGITPDQRLVVRQSK